VADAAGVGDGANLADLRGNEFGGGGTEATEGGSGDHEEGIEAHRSAWVLRGE